MKATETPREETTARVVAHQRQFLVTDPPKPRAKDLSQMQLFNETVNRLRRRKFVHDMVTKPSGVTISGRIGERIKEGIRGPDEEAVDAMILALRLLQQNDRTRLWRTTQM